MTAPNARPLDVATLGGATLGGASPGATRQAATSPAAPPRLGGMTPGEMTLGAKRLAGLDGIRGLAALFVVINHVFLRAFPGYPVNNAPFWAAWFIYGRFAVVVFIVLSGFSLAISPARSEWRLSGVSRFAHRRAWRILPPYWAALAFSVLMTWFVVAQPGWPTPNGKSAIVNGLLLQDAIDAPSPNRAFWSIAIEAQLYVVFPLLLLMIRRVSAAAMLSVVAALIIPIGVLAPHVPVVHTFLTRFTPDLAVLFAIGVAAAGVVAPGPRRRVPWSWLAILAAAPVIALIVSHGSVWTINNLFWVDMAFGPAIALLLIAVATESARPLTRALHTRQLRSLGSFSYSLYLTHAPIVIAIYYGIVAGRVRQGVPAFLVLAAVAVPAAVVFARLFAAVFEIPFVRHRGWGALRDAMASSRERRGPPHPPRSDEVNAPAANRTRSGTDRGTSPSARPAPAGSAACRLASPRPISDPAPLDRAQ
jgi:peptidoglycan/LPS O-acetylase OafA/YrhL